VSKAERPQNPLAYEAGFWGRGFLHVAGVDEVGRGPLAGPVVAAAVVLPPGTHIPEAGDSKRLTLLARIRVAAEVRAHALGVGIGAASVREIDALNIRTATALAMERAVRALPMMPDHLVVDGLPVPSLPWPHEAIVKGDGAVHAIGCASVIAKVCRDDLMRRLAQRYPGFGWERNAGYGTPEHLRALATLGPTPHHRRSFAPVEQVSLEF
jgi:ribonuclease HII